MKVQWIIFGVIGLVVLWLISRMGQGQEPQVIAEFIGSPQVEEGGSGSAQASEAIRAQSSLGIFQTLASLASDANAAILQRLGIEAQLEATKIGAETDRYTTRAQAYASQLAAGVSMAGIEADRQLGLRSIDAEENLYLEDLRNRAAQEQLHASAIERFVREHRGKISTDSSTVIFNALSSAFGRQQVSFAPERRQWYEPITKGIGNFISGIKFGVPV